jgi:hypothetical protein
MHWPLEWDNYQLAYVMSRDTFLYSYNMRAFGKTVILDFLKRDEAMQAGLRFSFAHESELITSLHGKHFSPIEL